MSDTPNDSFKKTILITAFCALIAGFFELVPKFFLESGQQNNRIYVEKVNRDMSLLKSKDLAFQAAILDATVLLSENILEIARKKNSIEEFEHTTKFTSENIVIESTLINTEQAKLIVQLESKIGKISIFTVSELSDGEFSKYSTELYGRVTNGKSLEKRSLLFKTLDFEILDFNEKLTSVNLIQLLTQSNIHFSDITIETEDTDEKLISVTLIINIHGIGNVKATGYGISE